MNFEQVRGRLVEVVRELAPGTEPGVMLAALENVTLQAKHAYLHALVGEKVQTTGGQPVPEAEKRLKK